MKKTKKTFNFKQIIPKVFTTHSLPLILTFTAIGLLYVLFRMKSIEQEYKFSQISTQTQEEKSVEKDLKAKRARLLSSKNLREIANKQSLNEPGENQIIVIP